MTTYQRGKHPEDAPAFWEYNDALGRSAAIYAPDKLIVVVAWREADPVCRAFHLAQLAEQAASTVEAFGTDSGGFRTDWLRRFRETKQ